MGAEDYLASTEPAVRHLFDGLAEYDKSPPQSILRYVDQSGLVRMSHEESESFLRDWDDFLALEFARATLCGSILQVAYMAMKLYSEVSNVSEKYVHFGVLPGSHFSKFSKGRERQGIPIGLLIYAGRIQYNHWEDGEPNRTVPRTVLRHLYCAYAESSTFDLAYDLQYPERRPISHYVVRLELRWLAYDDYLRDMRDLLK